MIDSIDREAKDDFFQQFFGSSASLHPTHSVEMMNHVTSSDKSPEEQIQSIKEIATAIGSTIENELVNLLSFAMAGANKYFAAEDKTNRQKRSADTPMGSAELVMRLLKHIKSNNEYQNIAIEKMMTAQEIAEKFGIEFRPDPEILSELAVSGTEQAKELTEILKDACDTKNKTLPVEYSFVSMSDDGECSVESVPDNKDYYNHHSETEPTPKNAVPIQEYLPEPINRQSNYHPQQHQQHPMYETQMPAPPMPRQPTQPHPNYPHPHHQNPLPNHPHPQQMQEPHRVPPVSQRPNFFEQPFTPAPEFPPSCSILEPFTTGAIFFPVEEMYEPEPELVGEEYEETVSSKVTVDHGDEPGSATVNHVMTYTLSEKAHFRPPQIQRLPEQMQYTFFLM